MPFFTRETFDLDPGVVQCYCFGEWLMICFLRSGSNIFCLLFSIFLSSNKLVKFFITSEQNETNDFTFSSPSVSSSDTSFCVIFIRSSCSFSCCRTNLLLNLKIKMLNNIVFSIFLIRTTSFLKKKIKKIIQKANYFWCFEMSWGAIPLGMFLAVHSDYWPKEYPEPSSFDLATKTREEKVVKIKLLKRQFIITVALWSEIRKCIWPWFSFFISKFIFLIDSLSNEHYFYVNLQGGSIQHMNF